MNHTRACPGRPVPSSAPQGKDARPGLFLSLLTVPCTRQNAWSVFPWSGFFVSLLPGLACMVAMAPLALASHRGEEEHHVASEPATEDMVRHTVPGAPFQVFLHEGNGADQEGSQSQVPAQAALQTVVQAFGHMMAHRTDYPRFHEALTKEALHRVIIEY